MITTKRNLKIDYATQAFETLLKGLLRPSIDRVSVISFGNTARVECPFTSHVPSALERLEDLRHTLGQEKTRLWETVQEAAVYFWQFGRRNAQWVQLLITDGGDSFTKDPVEAGYFIRKNFLFEPSNFLACVGVGEDRQIDAQALAKFARASGAEAITMKDWSALEAWLYHIAVRITTGISSVRYTLAHPWTQLSWTELQRVRNVTQFPLDLLLCIDRSGSMKNPA